MSAPVDTSRDAAAPPGARQRAGGIRALVPWLPLLALGMVTFTVLCMTHTPVWDITRFLGYAVYAVIGPGTLVFRSLRRTPHTLVEDLTYGAVLGLVLEIGAWALWSSLGLQSLLWTWPLVVYALFSSLPRLRRHWWVTGFTPVPPAFAWAVAAIGAAFMAYLYVVFLHPNPIVPHLEGQAIYLDLPFQLSLAGEAKHHFPMHVPQVAAEPLHYHYFAFAHQGASSLISGVDLTAVVLRLDIPLLCLASILALAVTGWRVTGRPAVGVIAAALTFTVGEFNSTDPVTMPFGTIATFIVWSSQSMTYSWLLLIVLIGLLVDRVAPEDRGLHPLGRGAWLALAAVAFVSVGAKASSVPVVIAALAFVGALQLLRRRRITRPVLLALAITIAAQAFGMVVIFALETHGMKLMPFWGTDRYYPEGGGVLAIGAIALAYGANMLLRLAGLPVLLWRQRRRIGATELLLLGGTLGGLGAYLVFAEPGDANQYFVRAGWMFGVIGSAWGLVLLYDKARLTSPTRGAARARRVLAVAALAYCAILIAVRLNTSAVLTGEGAMAPILPVLGWFAVLALIALIGGLFWFLAGTFTPAVRGRGGAALLTFALLAGVPGLVQESRIGAAWLNGGGHAPSALPVSRVEAARWLRDHSDPDDVVATNVHCRRRWGNTCDSRSFWLSAYSERRVLVEGWLFAPRANAAAAFGAGVLQPFWDPDLLALNDTAFYDPTVPVLARLRDEYGVKWLVADRAYVDGEPSEELGALASKVFDNGRIAIYALT